MLKVCSDSLGSFLPNNFPNAELKPQLHAVAHPRREKEEVPGFVHMETQQLIEAMHPLVNCCARQIRSVQDPQRKMALIAQSQWVAGGSELPSLMCSDQKAKHKTQFH